MSYEPPGRRSAYEHPGKPTVNALLENTPIVHGCPHLNAMAHEEVASTSSAVSLQGSFMAMRCIPSRIRVDNSSGQTLKVSVRRRTRSLPTSVTLGASPAGGSMAVEIRQENPPFVQFATLETGQTQTFEFELSLEHLLYVEATTLTDTPHVRAFVKRGRILVIASSGFTTRRANKNEL